MENEIRLTELGFLSSYNAEYDCKNWRNGKENRRWEGINRAAD